LKLTFINDIANLWEKLEINIDDLITWVWLDTRIWKSYMNTWIGYWWSCLSKDNQSFINFSANIGHDLLLIKDTEKLNEKQKIILVDKLINIVGDLEWKTISIWWLSFKENTDDIRYAPSIDIIKALLSNWVWKINLFDPKANDNVKSIFSNNEKLIFMSNKYGALEKADALLLLTWWEEFNNLDLQLMKEKMKWNIILDWRNFLNKQQITENGFIYKWIWK
jgi:UDPglucose 6-dehydrogenase